MDKTSTKDITDGRQCDVCHQILPADAFYKRKNRNNLLYRQCKQCFQNRYYHNSPHKQKALAHSRAQYQRVKESAKKYQEHLERARLRFQNNENVRQQTRERDRAYPDKARARWKRRRARLRSTEGSFTTAEWLDLCDKYNHRCLACCEQKPLTADHVIPVSKGGSSYISNIQPLCFSCNQRKYNRTIDYR